MRERFGISLNPLESLLVGASGVFGTLAVLLNPVAAGLPVAGTIATMTMLWSIDTVQTSESPEAEPCPQTRRDCS